MTTKTGSFTGKDTKEMDMINELERRFTYHSPKNDQPERYRALRGYAKHFAKLIVEITPSSREQSIALTKLEEASFWANASIARNE